MASVPVEGVGPRKRAFFCFGDELVRMPGGHTAKLICANMFAEIYFGGTQGYVTPDAAAPAATMRVLRKL